MQRHLWGFLAFCLAALPSSAAITGIVMTTDGQPVAGARVSIRTFESNEAARARLVSASPEAIPIATMQTDSKGAFSLESPKDATVDLNVFARGYEPHHRRIERDEEVGAIALQKSEMRKAGVTAGGKPVAGALVVVRYGAFEYFTKTDEQGRYEAPDPKRARAISVVHPDHAVNDESFFSMSGVSASSLQRTLVAGSAFQGRVVNGDKDTPVAKATVMVDGWPLATTGDDGTFTIAHMPPTWKTVSARKESLLGQRAYSKEASVTIRLTTGATISGRVTDAKTRIPVGGTIVTVGPRRLGPGVDNASQVLTDAKGAYSVVVPAGTHMVLASHPAYSTRPADANAVAGQQTSKDLAIAPLARVSGVVLDESKRPVVVAALDTANADTLGRGMPSMRMMRAGNPVVSGPDGRFSMRVPADEELWVRATKRGLPSAKSDSLQLTPGERRSGIVLTIPSGISVSGRAIDTHGDPLSGVAVTAAEVESGQRGMMMRMVMSSVADADDDSVRTASDGTFTMRVKEGTYDFTFRREGLAPKTVRGQSVTVTSSPTVEATMEPAVEIAGRVTRAGVGLENVMLMAMAPGISSATAVTAPDGSFTLSGLSAGSIRIMARKEDDFVQETRNITAPARDVVIEVRAGGRVTGRVVEKGSGKAITSFQAGISTSRGGGGMVMMAPPQLRSFTSDDGSFTLESVPPGAIILVASSPGYASGRLNLNIEEGKEVSGVELQLDTGVKLVGRVTGPNGSPLSDVQVRVLPSPTGGFASTGMDRMTSTDADGEYAIEALEAGEESLSFSHPKHASSRKQVTLKGRETRLDVQLSSGGRVTGTVVTESGAPVAEAQVDASSGSSWDSARTDANGAFEFESVTPGRYRFRASKTGLVEGVLEDVDVSTGAPVKIVLKTGGSIYGRITGLNAQELAQTQVTANARSTSAAGTVDATGNYRIEGVASGTVRVEAWSGNPMSGSARRAAIQTVELAPGGSQQLDIVFRDDIVISGRIMRNGMPLAGASVNFFPRGGSSRASGSSPADNDGQYSVHGLEEGEYSVMVNDSQRMSPYSTTYQVRGSATYDIEYKTNALRGRVLDVATNEPMANASVQLRNASTTEGPRMSRGGMTDATGSFIIDSISPGSYVVTASKDGFANDARELYVGDSSVEDLEFHLAHNVGVTLNVVDARDGRTVSARASVFDLQGRLVEEPRWSFFGGEPTSLKIAVPPGNYIATIWANGYAPRSVSFQSPSTQTVAVSPGGTLEVRSKHSEPMRIRLIDTSGMPYPRMTSAPPSRELLPSPGTTTLPNIAAGVYTLQLLNGEVAIDSKRVVVTEEQTVTEEI